MHQLVTVCLIETYIMVGGIYIVCLILLPFLLISSFFTIGWIKFGIMCGLLTTSGIVLFFKIGWIISFLKSQNIIKVPKSRILGHSPIHGVFTVLSIVGFAYSSIWMILDSHSTFRFILNLIFTLFYVCIIIYYYKYVCKYNLLE